MALFCNLEKNRGINKQQLTVTLTVRQQSSNEVINILKSSHPKHVGGLFTTQFMQFFFLLMQSECLLPSKTFHIKIKLQ